MPRPTNGDDDDGNEDYIDGDGGVDENYFRASQIYIFINFIIERSAMLVEQVKMMLGQFMMLMLRVHDGNYFW